MGEIIKDFELGAEKDLETIIKHALVTGANGSLEAIRGILRECYREADSEEVKDFIFDFMTKIDAVDISVDREEEE